MSESKYNVAFVCDDKYGLQLAVAVISVIDNFSDKGIVFHVIDFGINEKFMRELVDYVQGAGHELKSVNIDDNPVVSELKNFYLKSKSKKKDYISNVALSKYFAPLLSPGIDVILYLDADILVTSDLKGIFDLDLDEYLAAAACDMRLTHSRKNIRIGFDESDFYFNSGFVLFNAKKYREEKVIDQVVDVYKYFHDNEIFRFLDQDQLNFLFKNRVYELPISYNLFAMLPMHNHFGVSIEKALSSSFYFSFLSKKISKEQLKNAIERPVVVHFVTGLKPWNSFGGFKFSEWNRVVAKFGWLGRRSVPINVIPPLRMGLPSRLLVLLKKAIFYFRKVFK